MVGTGQDWEESIGSQCQDQFLNLKRRKDISRRTLCILIGVSLKEGTTSLMRRILEACNWRLTVFAGGYAANDGEGLPQVLTLLPTMIGVAVTGPDQVLPTASLSRMMKITTMSAKSLSHLLHVELKRESFLVGSLG